MLRSSVLCCACLLGSGLAGSADDYRLSGPYTHDNLTIFLIHGANGHRDRDFLTLQEALDQKRVVVYETGNVNELAIENSSLKDIYIQSGDIVKGGQQDRVFPDDFVLPPMSGKVPISSFCVEPGRWSRRGAEPVKNFSASTDEVPTKSLKLAARKEQNQAEVWQQVAEARAGLEQGTFERTDGTHLGVDSGGGVGSTTSTVMVESMGASTSMQVALENKKVNEAAAGYIKHLAKIIDRRPDVTGYVFAINGKLDSADIYASPDLFRRMWPKLLKSSAMAALAARNKQANSPPPDAATVRAALADAASGRESTKQIAGRLDVITRETGKAVLFGNSRS
jgi:hypothetical protein